MKSKIVLVLLTLVHSAMFAQMLSPLNVELQSFYTNNAVPVGIYNCGDNRLFILEKDQGDIEIVDLNGVYIGKFLDITGLLTTGGERGLLGLTFHPEYATNGFFYINYTNLSGHTVVARYHVSADANVADAASAFVVLTINQPAANHNGGHLAFGPDGYLYIGMGDGGGAGDPNANGQNPLALLGKMLRIDVNNGSPYSIPLDNPFYGQSDTLPEIWALGLRNPWKYSFDSATGDLWIGDVGQGTWEEIDFQPAGIGGYNYGWRCYEGNANYNTAGCQAQSFYDFPVAVYSHGGADSFCSISGGVVYRGQAYPAMDGYYFFSDYCNAFIHSLQPDGQGNYPHQIYAATTTSIVAFGEDMNGEVYVVNNSGPIFKLVESCPFYPTINSNGTGSLIAEAGTQYWWYKDAVLIDGATNQSYTPTSAGVYYAHINNGECIRKSNEMTWTTISGVAGCTYPVAINYNANADVDDGSCQFSVDCTCPADLNLDGVIGVSDLILFIGLYGVGCQ